ncbi:MAG: DNA topoisomerase IB [Candidatus Poseidoniales archaeon]|nr:MAG: DNA topoisomerase IB [Candidatus Poseidoniales archaeon]
MELSVDEALTLSNLVRSDRTIPGITRMAKESSGDGLIDWTFKTADGKVLTDTDRIAEINALAIPPAWTEVWVCPNDRGHIQATGVDGKGRLQYRYHPDWISMKTRMKFEGIAGFAEVLPALRKKITRDLKRDSMDLEKVSALVVRLMDLYNIRVGSDEYARTNESYGLTTLRNGHMVRKTGENAEGRHDAVFSFTGKSGKSWEILIEDDNLVDLLLETRKLGSRGKDTDLFHFVNLETENENDLKAEHINQYIQDATGESYTAKNFRTWAATWKCAYRLAFIDNDAEGSELEKFIRSLPANENLQNLVNDEGRIPLDSDTARNKAMLAVVDTVASNLGNTRAVCRSSYIHPIFLESFLDESIGKKWSEGQEGPRTTGLSDEESIALNVLRQ